MRMIDSMDSWDKVDEHFEREQRYRDHEAEARQHDLDEFHRGLDLDHKHTYSGIIGDAHRYDATAVDAVIRYECPRCGRVTVYDVERRTLINEIEGATSARHYGEHGNFVIEPNDR